MNRNGIAIGCVFFALGQFFLCSCSEQAPDEPDSPPPNPVVSLRLPNEELVGESTLIAVDATDDKGITKVEIYIDNSVPAGGTFVVPPYEFLWNTGSLTDSSVHSIYAKAFDADGNATSTPVVLVRVFKLAPSSLTMSFVTDTLVMLTWRDNSSKETGFEIQRRYGLGEYLPVTTTSANVASFGVVGEYLAGADVAFRVRALRDTAYSQYSNVVSAILTFGPPTGVVVTDLSDSSVSLQWTNSVLYLTATEVLHGLRSDQLVSLAIVDGGGASASITGSFDPFSPHFFGLKTRTSLNTSLLSVVVQSGPLLLSAESGMLPVAGGTFQMGSTTGYPEEQPVHSVTLSAFFISKTEVTQRLWREVVEWKLAHGGTTLSSDPSYEKGDSLPVTRISWADANAWLGYLNARESTNKYRLPTEAEWEYVARGGNQSQGYVYSGGNTIGQVAWYSGNAAYKTHMVAAKQPNELGVFDMSGNVWEWCSDWYGPYSSSSQTDPPGPSTGTLKVMRGGSYDYDAGFCRPQLRKWNETGVTNTNIGFRIARTQ